MLCGAKATSLFVFGDSYVDTGNRNQSAQSWNSPYGMTWPRRPSGRFSNGRLLTDYLAQAMGTSSPVPYAHLQQYINLPEGVKDGINFAFAGSGVFAGYEPTNFATQVDQFEELLRANLSGLPSLTDSVVLLSTGGNDYLLYLAANGSLQELPAYIVNVTGEIVRNVERLHGLGMKKFVISNLGNMGCAPYVSAVFGFRRCVKEFDLAIAYHNNLLLQGIKASLGSGDDADFVILDQVAAFSFIFHHQYLFGLKHKLQPCCIGMPGTDTYCAQTSESGESLFTLCKNPQTHFFWDHIHPTQAGWAGLTSLFIDNSGFIQSKTPTTNLATWLSCVQTSRLSPL
ncbi:hypothetical protein O6H91_04G039700 [Diphasiastrum complanatum]|nr:hypothetical protein O6H91_04G039700 [Diphasiastrum complanatum]